MISCPDAASYAFHAQDRPDRCFCCTSGAPPLVVVRHIATRKMVHLCPSCLLHRLSDYLLDNTRSWSANRETPETL